MNGVKAFVDAILGGDLDACGVFADWLEEHGLQRAGVLLRRRWKMWKVWRDGAQYKAYCIVMDSYRRGTVAHNRLPDRINTLARMLRNLADDSLMSYVEKRFPIPSEVTA